MEEREFMRMERKLKKIGPQGGRGWGTAIASNWTAIKINILVEEREFMRMERDCEADEHL